MSYRCSLAKGSSDLHRLEFAVPDVVGYGDAILVDYHSFFGGQILFDERPGKISLFGSFVEFPLVQNPFFRNLGDDARSFCCGLGFPRLGLD